VLAELRSAVPRYRDTLAEDRREVLRRCYLARKVIGVGSAGLEAFVMVLLGAAKTSPSSSS